MTVGENLQRLLAEKGLTQRALARQSGVSASYIGALIKGTRTRISVDKAEKLAMALGVPSTALTGPATVSLHDMIAELGRRSLLLEMAEVPVRGAVSRKESAAEVREQGVEYLAVPRSYLGEGDDVFALEVTEALLEEGIAIGDYVIVNPGETVGESGGIYILELRGQRVLRRARRVGSRVYIQPPLSGDTAVSVEEVVAVGRVVSGGRWRRF